MNGNLLVKNAAQVVTCSGFEAKGGADMADLKVIENGAILVKEGKIAAVGPSAEIETQLPASEVKALGFDVIDAQDKAVLPGFVDSHTHLVFGGYRPEEFGWRLRGDSYMDIMQRGGGILNTVRATRTASKEELIRTGIQRLNSMLTFGVTTVEAKSGYGLDRDTEIKQLEALQALDQVHYVDIAATFLGAHAVPEAYQGRSDEYLDWLTAAVMPEIAERNLAEFCDIFCEEKVFGIAQSSRFLKDARAMGFKLKLHADEIVPLGGAALAAELGAVSADHLLQSSDEGIRKLAETGVVATLLPGTAFSLKEPFARGRDMIEQNCAVALATDFNPGSCFSESIPLIFALTTLYMQLSTEEAITALTINGAAAIDRADTVGSIDIGKLGDLVILEFPHYNFIPYHIGVSCVDKVIKNGNLVFDKTKGGLTFC